MSSMDKNNKSSSGSNSNHPNKNNKSSGSSNSGSGTSNINHNGNRKILTTISNELYLDIFDINDLHNIHINVKPSVLFMHSISLPTPKIDYSGIQTLLLCVDMDNIILDEYFKKMPKLEHLGIMYNHKYPKSFQLNDNYSIEHLEISTTNRYYNSNSFKAIFSLIKKLHSLQSVRLDLSLFKVICNDLHKNKISIEHLFLFWDEPKSLESEITFFQQIYDKKIYAHLEINKCNFENPNDKSSTLLVNFKIFPSLYIFHTFPYSESKTRKKKSIGFYLDNGEYFASNL